jgi:hypothetical protein
MISAAVSINSMIYVPHPPSITETLNVAAGGVAIAAVIGEDCGRNFFARDA